jgi:acylphosphatase
MGSIKTGNIYHQWMEASGFRRSFFSAKYRFGFQGRIDDLVDRSIEIIAAGNGSFLNWNEFKEQVREGCTFNSQMNA